MTDRVKGFTVTLEKDMRTDDVEVIKNAIEMIRGVAKVDWSIVTADDHFNRTRIRQELSEKLWKALKEE